MAGSPGATAASDAVLEDHENSVLALADRAADLLAAAVRRHRERRMAKYSPLKQIDRANVQSLQIAWSWESPDDALLGKQTRERPGYLPQKSNAAEQIRCAGADIYFIDEGALEPLSEPHRHR